MPYCKRDLNCEECGGTGDHACELCGYEEGGCTDCTNGFQCAGGEPVEKWKCSSCDDIASPDDWGWDESYDGENESVWRTCPKCECAGYDEIDYCPSCHKPLKVK